MKLQFKQPRCVRIVAGLSPYFFSVYEERSKKIGEVAA